jgi:hypothetical protein
MFRILGNGKAGVAGRSAASGDAGVADECAALAALDDVIWDRPMALEISGVALCPTNDLITAAYIDYPRTGSVDGYAFDVHRWVISMAPVAEVEFVHEGIVIACCELGVERPYVAKKFGGSPQVGFWKAIETVGLTPAFTIGLRVVFKDGGRSEIAEIRATQHRTSAFTPTLQPITATSPGRSGSSTLLTRMLAEHSDIVVHERFPYEQRVSSYWMNFEPALATPVTPHRENHSSSGGIKTLIAFPSFFLDLVFAGSVSPTFDRWFGSDQVEEFTRVAQATVGSFYREHARGRNARPLHSSQRSSPRQTTSARSCDRLPADGGDIPWSPCGRS